MPKYETPQPTFADVLAALPPLPQPIAWRLAVYPPGRASTTYQAAVELVIYDPYGAAWVFKRWGRAVSLRGRDTTASVLLQAAFDAHAYVDGKDVDELVKLITWEAGAVRMR